LLSTVLLAQSAPVTTPNAPAASAVGQAVPAIPLRPIPELRQQALKATPPVEKLEFRKPLLIELGTAKDDPIHLDIRYATANNFLGTPVYTEARAFLQLPAAMALRRVAEKLKKQGYGLVIFDGYRPWFVTKIFWDATPPALHEYVADPAEGSRHNRGCAVDLTLYDLKTGQPVAMPSGYDEMTERAHSNYSGGREEEREHRKVLREVMLSEGFEPIPDEWWHYDYKDWIEYPVLNVAFDALPMVYRVGKEVTAPKILKRVQPVFSEEARKHKYQGMVLLDLVVGANGKPMDVSVVRSLGMGLDANAVEAAKQWEFAPALRDGAPVAVEIYMEINFHLYGKNPSPDTGTKENQSVAPGPNTDQGLPPTIAGCSGAFVPPKWLAGMMPQIPDDVWIRTSGLPHDESARLHILVTERGKVKVLSLLSGPGGNFDRAAKEAVREWRYSPATCDGVPMPIELNLDTKFVPPFAGPTPLFQK
jgi:D-alanyl-D-alanine dipeptidase